MDTEPLKHASAPQHTARQDGSLVASQKLEYFHHLHNNNYNMETYSMEPVLRDHMQPSVLNSSVFPAVVPHSSLVDVVGH